LVCESSIRAAIFLAAVSLCRADSLPEALQSKRYQDALTLSDALLVQHPDDVRSLTARGMALAGLRRDRESIGAFEKALKYSPNFLPALQGAVEAGYRSRDPRASAFLARLIEISPGNTVANAMAGVLAFEQGDCALALRHFEQSLAEIESNDQAFPIYGACLLKAQRAEQAVDVFEKILAKTPDSSDARFNLGNAQLLARRPADAINTLKPLAQDPNAQADTLNLIASAEAAGRQLIPATEHLRRAAQLAPRDDRNYVDLGTIYVEQNAIKMAVEVVAIGLKQVPGSARLHSLSGAIQAQLGNAQQAAAEFDLANSLDSIHEYGAAGLGLLYTEAQRPDLAVPMLRDRLKRKPDDPMLNYLLAQAIMSEQVKPETPQYEEARMALDASTKAKPEFTRAHNLLGKLYEQAGDYQKALQQFHIAHEQDSEDRTALSHLAIVLRRLGRTDDADSAIAQLRQVIVEQSHRAEQVRLRPPY